ncbi:MAG: NAD(P)-dependent oxidoreductase [Nanoarchaeota archaeon]|nr:NAD(P)-dependent oxidoreductase [Nanoarchaeota archaeon]
MKALVTGASGFIGRELVRQLLASGVKVRGISRKPINQEKGIEWVRCDLGKPETLQGVCEGADVIFHLAANNKQDSYLVNVAATDALIKDAIRYNVRQFIYFSSFSVFGIIQDRHMPDLDQAHAPFSGYALTKYQGEQACLRNKGISLLIIRPPFVYDFSEPRHDLRLINVFIKAGIVPVIGSGNNYFNIISRRSLAEKTIALFLGKKEGIHLLMDEAVTFNEFLGRCMKEAGRKNIMKLHFPIWSLYVPIFLYENAANIFGVYPEFSIKRLEQIRRSG